MIERARNRIIDEMDEGGPELKALGELLLPLAEQYPDAFLDKQKTLKGTFEEARKAARSKAKNSCYCMPPDEMLRIACKYYGIDAKAVKTASVASPARVEAPARPVKRLSLLDLDL